MIRAVCATGVGAHFSCPIGIGVPVHKSRKWDVNLSAGLVLLLA